MAKVFPFQPYRYTQKAGPLSALVTQPYDKITPEMQKKYLAANPHNLVRIILGERKPDDSEGENVYTRAADYLQQWIAAGVLARESSPSLYAYFQEFTVPDTGERLVRKGFIGVGGLEEYSAGVVHRHEQTLTGPKKDRTELLRHTRAHFGQIFMLYPDPKGEIDLQLDGAAAAPADEEVIDEYGAVHRVWRISDAARIQRIQELMASKKMVIADGHHRYETALAFHKENPALEGASKVMMTFVNMHSPGLQILATHRMVSNLPGFDVDEFVRKAAVDFQVDEIDSAERLKNAWRQRPDKSIIGAAIGNRLFLLEARDLTKALDVHVLHDVLLDKVLGIGEQAIRDEKNLRYMRGLDKAIDDARSGACQIAFLLKPTSVQQVADISFGGGVMPQKSTDFYPKLLSGLTIYKLEK